MNKQRVLLLQWGKCLKCFSEKRNPMLNHFATCANDLRISSWGNVFKL